MTTITAPKRQVLKGTFVNTGTLVIDGPGKFDPGSYTDDDTSVVNADVIGAGTFLSNSLTFGGSVGPHVMVDLGPQAGRLMIDHPKEFKGTVGLGSLPPLYNGPTGDEIDLVGLANADGYSFKNDILRITDHGRIIDRLHLANSAATQPFVVAEVQGSTYVLYGEFAGLAASGTILPKQPLPTGPADRLAPTTMLTIGSHGDPIYTTSITVTPDENLLVRGFGLLDAPVTDTGAMTVDVPVLGGKYLDEGSMTLNAAVISGKFTDEGQLTFGSQVGPHTEITFLVNDSGKAVIDQPRLFHGTINLQPSFLASAPAAYSVDLVHLSNVDSYSLKNDLVTLYGANGKPVDAVHLAKGSVAPLVFADGGSTYLTWGYGPNTLPGYSTLNGPVLVPQHTV